MYYACWNDKYPQVQVSLLALTHPCSCGLAPRAQGGKPKASSRTGGWDTPSWFAQGFPNFLGLQNHCRWWLQPWNKKMLTPWKKSYDQPRQHVKKQRHYFSNKGPSCQGYGFLVVMYGCESWTMKKVECRRTDAFELWY